MTSLVGKALEEDDAFWTHDTWAEEGSDNDSFRDSDEDSAMKKDEFDSDFNDSETDNEEEEKAAGMDEEDEIRREERSNQQRKTTYIDVGKGIKKKGRGKRIVGDGMNAGIVLNFPVASAATLPPTQVPSLPQVAPLPGAQPLAPKQTARKNVPSIASRRVRRSQNSARRLRETRSTPADPHTGRKTSKPALTKKAKRRLYAQEELLLEAVHHTEPENQRWLLARKRENDTDKDKDSLSLRDRNRGKVVQKYHSRRGCLITLTFPDMDTVPEILTRPKSTPEKPKKTYCVITGKPARYRDPQTKLGYYDAAACKELRRRQTAGEPLDQRPKLKPPTPAMTAPQASTNTNDSSSAKTPLSATSGENAGLDQADIEKPQGSIQNAPSTDSNSVSNPLTGSAASNIMDTHSPPVSPSGRRSQRKWKPSEKLLRNIVQGRTSEGGLAARMRLKPDGAGNQADAISSETPSKGISASSLPLSKPVTYNGNKAAVSLKAENAAAKASINMGGDNKMVVPSTTATASKTNATKQVASKKRKAPEKSNEPKEKKSRKKPAPKNVAKNTSLPAGSKPSILQREKVYVWSEEGETMPHYITQSDLIMDAIKNYAEHQEERKNER